MRRPLLIALALAALLPPASRGAHAQKRPVSVEECAACHGPDGIARDSEVPNLAGQNERYLFNQIMAFHNGKRVHKEMRYMARAMSVDEMAALAAYYAGLPPR